MGRDELKDVEKGGFVEYREKQLPKTNAMRRDKSQPDFFGVPILTDGQVMFTRASEMGDKPASCYTCQFQQSDETCNLLGPTVPVRKVRGNKDSGEQIEYWPRCNGWCYGNPQKGKPHYSEYLSTPDQLGLIWINAPKVGQALGGSNCGGISGADDCDHYITSGRVEKWDTKQGACRVLQHSVGAGDFCIGWRDDDILAYQDARILMEGKGSLDLIDKKKLVKSIMGRD